ncbi:MAG TPA: hypothetical protein ENK88_06110 [Campylobacterales bacterium]|nr:hypothetical protein [Campylobacterales bacterium]
MSSNELWSEKNLEGRWRKYTYEEILLRDNTNLDIIWLKDDSFIDIEKLPKPEILIDEIVMNLESALASFRVIKDSI